MDGDGRGDLIWTGVQGLPPEEQRTLRVHFGAEDGSLSPKPDWTRALLAALAVLVMGYPCALGMATPLAMIRGGGMAAERGILMRSGEAFQALKDVRKVVLDKTGTITCGEPAVVEVVAFGDHDVDGVIRLAAAAESGSEHPLGQAIVSAAEQFELRIASAEGFMSTAGKGVTAIVEGSHVLVGKPRYLVEENVELEPVQSRLETMQREGYTVVENYFSHIFERLKRLARSHQDVAFGQASRFRSMAKSSKVGPV